MRIADLGRDSCASGRKAAPWERSHLPRMISLAPPAVGVGGVEPPKADTPGMVEQLQRLFLAVAGAAQFRRRADPAEIAAAEPNPIDIALSQHLTTLWWFEGRSQRRLTSY